jgi:hypothetical protein
MEVSEEYLQGILSNVFLWDVKNETKHFLFMCDSDYASQVVKNLEEHGYKANITNTWFLASQIQIDK